MHKLYMHTYVHTSAHSNAANSSLVKQCGSLISVTRLTSGLTHALAVLLRGMVLYMPTPRALGPVTVLTQVNPKALHATIPGGRRTDGQTDGFTTGLPLVQVVKVFLPSSPEA